MNYLETRGKILLQQHEGDLQLAAALAESAGALSRRLMKLLVTALRHVPDTHPIP